MLAGITNAQVLCWKNFFSAKSLNQLSFKHKKHTSALKCANARRKYLDLLNIPDKQKSLNVMVFEESS